MSTKVENSTSVQHDAKLPVSRRHGIQWRVNTVALLKEIGEYNPTMGIMRQPLNIFGRILEEVAIRASELNDDKLNALMCRLALYEISDPYSKDYDAELTEATIAKGR